MTFVPKIFQCPKCGARNKVRSIDIDGPQYQCKDCDAVYGLDAFAANYLPDGQHPPLQPKVPEVMPPFEAHARSNDPATAKAAAQEVSGARVTELERQVVAVLSVSGPLTAWQIAKRGEMEYGSTSPRLSTMEEKGLVRRVGEKAVEGRKKSTVWGLTV